VRRSTALAGALAAGATILLTGPAAQAAETRVLHPSEIDFSQTRSTGHYEVVDTGLRIWTDGATSTDKVAGYVSTDVALAGIGEPSLDYANTGGGVPGLQLVVDFDGDRSGDGILIGEPVYDGDWWLNTAAKPFVRAGAPVTGGGSGGPHHGTLAQWRAAFTEARVQAFGFSLGSGVKGDGVIESIEFDGTIHTFAEDVVLEAKQDCKGGGWATSTKPVFRNQGECVASLARPAGR
jgi:hypothetical protein